MLTARRGPVGAAWVTLVTSGLVPLVVYSAVRPRVGGDTEALAMGWFVPVAWTLGSSLCRRRLAPLGLAGVVAYGVALCVSVLFGAGALPLKLHHAVVSGLVGLACLVSIAVDRPLLALLIRRLSNITTEGADSSDVQEVLSRRSLTRLTVVVGFACLLDAAVQTALAVALPTSEFLSVRAAIHVAAIAFIVMGAIVLFGRRSFGPPGGVFSWTALRAEVRR